MTRFQLYQPCDRLRPYVKRLIFSEALNGTTYSVLPDTAPVMGFQYRGKLTHLDSTGPLPLARSGITGLMDTYRLFENSNNIGTVLVVFTETGAASFFREPANELFGRSVSLDNFIDHTTIQCLEEQLMEATDDRQRINSVEQFMLSRLQEPKADPIVLAALHYIHQSRGTVRIKDLADKLCISQSPLEKRFRKRVGASPKKFSSIVRINHAINVLTSMDTMTGLTADSGYFDQAHFIKDFRQFTGLTPTQFLRNPVNRG